MMNRNQLKLIAIGAMLIDHISMFFIPIATPLGMTMRIIGRLTAPIMCFFLAEGFIHTSSKKKYGIRLFVFAVISQFAYAFSHGNSLLEPDFNVILTLFLCFVILLAYEKIENPFLKMAVILALIAASMFSDWGIIAPLWVLTFFVLHDDEKYKNLVFSIVSLIHVITSVSSALLDGYAWHSQLWQAGVFLFLPLIYFYNGKNGNKNKFFKWMFYIFYPLHLCLLKLIDTIIL